jgi:DNA-binding transcriptional ArsR family regulator
MVKSRAPVLDRTFSALADPHRREILDLLGAGPLSLSELAAPLDMSLPGALKHVRALEEARLVETHKRGRVRTCQLARRPLDDAARWIEQRGVRWERQLASSCGASKVSKGEHDELLQHPPPASSRHQPRGGV